MSGIGVIHNPFARGNLKRPHVVDELRRIMDGNGIVRVTRNIDMLPAVAEDFKRDGIDIIAVNGGDGTLSIALTAFIKVYQDRPLPRVLSLRGGTMNTMSNSLKLKGKTVGIMEKAVEMYRRGEPFETMDQHLVKVNERYGVMTGCGVVSNFLDAYYSGSGTGPTQAVKVILKAMGSALTGGNYVKKLFAPTIAKVTLEGEVVPLKEFTAMMACSILEIGLGFQFTSRAYESLDKFHFLATSIRPLPFIPKIPYFYLGKIPQHEQIYSRTASQVIIEPPGSLRYVIDGEIYEYDGPIEITTGPVIKVIKL